MDAQEEQTQTGQEAQSLDTDLSTYQLCDLEQVTKLKPQILRNVLIIKILEGGRVSVEKQTHSSLSLNGSQHSCYELFLLIQIVWSFNILVSGTIKKKLVLYWVYMERDCLINMVSNMKSSFFVFLRSLPTFTFHLTIIFTRWDVRRTFNQPSTSRTMQ